MVVDDHPVVRQGLRAYLSSCEGIQVVADAGDGDEALRKIRHLKPDVVLLDLQMPGTDGLGVLEALSTQDDDPPVRTLVLTSFPDGDKVMTAVRAGAAGYLLKDAEPSQVEEAIRAVHRGESPMHPRVTSAVLAEVNHPQSAVETAGLTPREAEVLALIAQGLTNRLIGRRLGVAEKTVKTHVSNVLAKLAVTDRTQAALWAIRHDIPGIQGAQD